MRRVVGLALPLVVCGLAALLVFSLGSTSVEARPQYNGEFDKAYPDLAEAHKAVKCDLCHVPKEKKDKRNAYGTAVGKALGKENVKDLPAIKEALTAAEKEKSAVEGKTFGDLIKAKQLPCSDK